MNREKIRECVVHFSGRYEAAKVRSFSGRSFSPEFYASIVDETGGNGFLEVSTVGRSFEGRPIRLIEVGSGRIRVLLWSQMHGDESTATMAIADILRFLASTRQDETISGILSNLRLQFLPILNPDGAARFKRRTAQGIDMNRDALALSSPEARILKQLQHDLQPGFGFNLHDQELSTVGTTKELTAIALLAPASDPQQTVNFVRARALSVAAVFASAMQDMVPGRVCRYDDTFEPRAFGDNMQRWGTSTVLVESGHAREDPSKDVIRKLNFVGILTSLLSIATGGWETVSPDLYHRLPFNGKKAYDVIVRNVVIDHGDGRATPADLGVSYQVDTHSELPPKLVDIGDLRTYLGLKEIDAEAKPVSASVLRIGEPFPWETYFPVAGPGDGR